MTKTPEPQHVPDEFLADESIFRCEVTLPDPSSQRRMNHTQGSVAARLTGDPSSKPVGALDFSMKDGVLSTIRYKTDTDQRRKGCAREMTKALRREYLGTSLVSSQTSPTSDGHSTLVQLHEEGLIDELRLDLSNGHEDPETD